MYFLPMLVAEETASRQRGVCVEHLKRCKASNVLDEFAMMVWIIDAGSFLVFHLTFK
jgi:hypothetical protein